MFFSDLLTLPRERVGLKLIYSLSPGEGLGEAYDAARISEIISRSRVVKLGSGGAVREAINDSSDV